MAESMLSEQELTCSICLDIFTDPVSTPCGHNFCQSCIGRYWANRSNWSCPLCKRQFSERPQLAVNRVFAHITSKCKESHYRPEEPKLGTDSESVVTTCDVCTGKKLKAVSSCLTCTASYCEVHVQPHLQNPSYTHHKLLDPSDAFQGRTCPIHNRLLEVYCCTDQVCICAICAMEEHSSHRTVSVQTERARKQKFLGKLQFEIQKKTEEKSIKLTALKNKVEFLRNFAQSEISDVDKILTDLNRSVDRIRGELVGGIMEKQAAMETRGQELISQVEEEVVQLRERQANLEAQATSEDHIGFLQNFQNALEPLETDMEKHQDDDIELPLHLEIVKRALGELQERLEDIHVGEVQSENTSSLSESPSMMSLHGMRRKERSLRDLTKVRPASGLKKIRAYTEDVTLNPMTAYPFLIVSEDCKQVKRGEKIKLNGGGSQRYDVWSCVVAKEGFTSGRHYWEVNVGDSKDWKLGVVRESAPRKGLFDMSPRIGYYALWWSANQLRVLTSPLTKVRISNRLRRVGIYIDCEEGQVVFYNAKTGSVVHVFSGEEFSEKMLPLFGTGDKDVALVLSTAENQIPE